MPKIKAVCPECAAVLSLGESVTPGKNIRCPKCQSVFPVPEESVESAAPNGPRRFKSKKQSSSVGTIIAIVAASVLVLGGVASAAISC